MPGTRTINEGMNMSRTNKQPQRMPGQMPTAYRRVTLPVPTRPQNEIEELGRLLLFGAVVCFAAGAIARSL